MALEHKIMRLLDLDTDLLKFVKEKYSAIINKIYPTYSDEIDSESERRMQELRSKYFSNIQKTGNNSEDKIVQETGRHITNPFLNISWNTSSIKCNILPILIINYILQDKSKDSIRNQFGKGYRLAGINDIEQVLIAEELITDTPLLCGIAIESYNGVLAEVDISYEIERLENINSGNAFNTDIKYTGQHVGSNGNGNGADDKESKHNKKINKLQNEIYIQDVKENFGLQHEANTYIKTYSLSLFPVIFPIHILIADSYVTGQSRETNFANLRLPQRESLPIITLPKPLLPKHNSEITKQIYDAIQSMQPYQQINIPKEGNSSNNLYNTLTIFNSKAPIRLITLSRTKEMFYLKVQDSNLTKKQKYNPLLIEDE